MRRNPAVPDLTECMIQSVLILLRDKTLEEIEREIAARDKNDMERDYMPLRCAEDAVLIDSSSLTIDEVTEQMLRLIREKEKE